jgi:cytosine/adenosine deaminase-related metal-dependent hydrolase
VPISSDPEVPSVIEDGAVLTENGRISKVGKYSEIKTADAELVEHENCILTPGLVNCHTHLELSHLASLGADNGPDTPGDIASWIRKLLAARVEAGFDDDHTFDAWQALAKIYATGCRAVADIGNLPESRGLGINFKAEVFFFLEFLGLSASLEKEAMGLLETVEDDQLCTGHAAYSTSAALIRQLKNRSNRLGHFFPIHVAESADEIEFLRSGTGRLRDFLEERQALNESFVCPGNTAVNYLDGLGVLDEKTLCVHCVHVTDDEIFLLAKRKANVCLCPGSNRYMGVGKAPVQKMLDVGIIPVLGTDSLASNPHLSIWQEMKILMEEHPGLDPSIVFRMASRRGAEVLGLDQKMGCLEPGRSASFLAVEGNVGVAGQVFEYLTSVGLDAKIEWVE